MIHYLSALLPVTAQWPNREALTSLVTAFEHEHPECRVLIQEVESSALARMEKAQSAIELSRRA